MSKENILEIQNLQLNYGSTCVGKHITLSLSKGESLGIAGESGSGKSTLLKAIVDPESYGVTVEKGRIQYKGMMVSEWTPAERQKIKGTEIGMILQNPYTNFNPIRPYKKQFAETLKSHNMWQGKKSISAIQALFKQLGLDDGRRILSSCPYEMSGGMNQRISIVVSMMLQPSLILADEPTSALDAASQAQVVEELWHLRKMSELSMIMVSHNLSMIAQICDTVAIMHKGQIVEFGDIREVLLAPKHWYTNQLLKAIP
ncbi:ABC transporter ATP-binding protein [Vallitalea pronyensis]|uniref:ABC transporter ATP-binding protein n=1 Tax=Vallitalea pronyensis TaxID=1348613 RepID=A0A8J8MPM4_9FIRM|nr:ABC transporter ATP-binding protein [Vallitalea pronyensis]QUI25314.1 ABC transporter ATP-binding protein [Vallitalea pronyensis]